MSRFDHIIRLRKWELDEKRRVLRQLQSEEDEVISRIEALDVEVSLQMANTASEASVLTMGNYLEGVRLKQEQFEHELAAKQEEIAELQDKVAEAFRELKTFEIAKERELKRAQDAEAKEEQDAFDELGSRAPAREEVQTDSPILAMRGK